MDASDQAAVGGRGKRKKPPPGSTNGSPKKKGNRKKPPSNPNNYSFSSKKLAKLTKTSYKIELVARIDGIPRPKYRYFAVTNKKTEKPIVHDENKHHVESF